MVYCTKDNVKAYCKIAYTDLGYANDSAFDTFLDGLIASVQGLIDSFCRVPASFFNAGGLAITNEIHDYQYPWINLKCYPVLSVSKVEYNDQGYGITPNWVTVTSPDYIINNETGQVMLVSDVPAIPEQSVRISYTAGYSAAPGVIEHVAIHVCSTILHEILQRKLSPPVRADDINIKVLTPEVFSIKLQTILVPYTRRSVAVG